MEEKRFWVKLNEEVTHKSIACNSDSSSLIR